MSVSGTTRTSGDVRFETVKRSKADIAQAPLTYRRSPPCRFSVLSCIVLAPALRRKLRTAAAHHYPSDDEELDNLSGRPLF
jgi:hypothetical protein